MADLTDDELFDLLPPEPAKKHAARSAQDERIIAGFEDILAFAEKHGRAPQHGDQRDIFERLYAVRLDRLRELPNCRAVLADLDTQGLLQTPDPTGADSCELDDDALLAAIETAMPATDDITTLRHVRPTAEIRAAEDIANRTPCADFQLFAPLFAAIGRDLASGLRQTRPFGREAEIRQGEFFIVGGQTAYVANMGELFDTEYDRPDRKLRVIYDNKTESDIRLRSLQRALYKDAAGRRITTPNAGPLFDNA